MTDPRITTVRDTLRERAPGIWGDRPLKALRSLERELDELRSALENADRLATDLRAEIERLRYYEAGTDRKPA